MRSLVSLVLYVGTTDIFSQQMYQVNVGLHPSPGPCCSQGHWKQDSTSCPARASTSADHAPASCSPASSMARTCLSHAFQSAAAQAPLLLASYSSPSRSPSSHFWTFHSQRPRQSGPRYAELAFNRSKSIPVESSLGFSTHENILARSGGHVAQPQLRLTLFEFHRTFQFQNSISLSMSIVNFNRQFQSSIPLSQSMSNHISRISGTFLEPI